MFFMISIRVIHIFMNTKLNITILIIAKFESINIVDMKIKIHVTINNFRIY